MTSFRGVATKSDAIPFEAGDNRKDPKSIRWEKVWAVEDGSIKGKERAGTFELQSHEKSRGGAPIPC